MNLENAVEPQNSQIDADICVDLANTTTHPAGDRSKSVIPRINCVFFVPFVVEMRYSG
jgi:hypothetical protein